MNGCKDKQTKHKVKKSELWNFVATQSEWNVCVCVCANEKGKSKKRVQRCLLSFIHPQLQLQLCSGIYCQLVTHTQFAETIKICLSVKWKKVCQFVRNLRQTETVHRRRRPGDDDYHDYQGRFTSTNLADGQKKWPHSLPCLSVLTFRQTQFELLLLLALNLLPSGTITTTSPSFFPSFFSSLGHRESERRDDAAVAVVVVDVVWTPEEKEEEEESKQRPLSAANRKWENEREREQAKWTTPKTQSAAAVGVPR